MIRQSPYHIYQRYRTLQTHRVTALPIVILMPHSACNCRCVMCDIWKGNRNVRQLTELDVKPLLTTLKKYGTRQVVMSGGEAMLNPAFFQLCRLLKEIKIHITLLSTGITLRQHAEKILTHTDDVIVSLDGDEKLHDRIRNINGAYSKLKEGIQAISNKNQKFPITARTVIHRLNFRRWQHIIEAAAEIGVKSISFLPADTSSTAFNRELPWSPERQGEIAPSSDELDSFKLSLEEVIRKNTARFNNGFIVESPEKLRKIYDYYCAVDGLCEFPYKKCNAPWVSTVIEADGNVRPCFFHQPIGNIRQHALSDIMNSETGIQFRKELDMNVNDTCRRCVCSLYLSPLTSIH